MIKAITKYKYKGEEYNTLLEVKKAVENTIGEEVLDKINKTISISHKDLIKLFDILCEPEIRKTLIECFSVTYEKEIPYCENALQDTETHNILDLYKTK